MTPKSNAFSHTEPSGSIGGTAMATRLEDLTAMRELLWTSIEATIPEKRAPLFARLESVVLQIEQLSPKDKAGDPVDEIAKRRSARKAGTAQSSSRPAADQG